LSCQNTKFQKANTKFQINPNTEIRNTKQNQNTNQLSAVSRKHAYPNCRSRESGNLLNKPCLNHIHEIRFTRKPEDFISPLLAGYQPSAVSNPLQIDKNIALFIYDCLIMEQYEALLLPNLSFVDIKYKNISFIWLFNQCKASLILSYILLG
jgi:hypothetical protein